MLEQVGRALKEGIVNSCRAIGARAATLLYQEPWGWRVSLRSLADDVDVPGSQAPRRRWPPARRQLIGEAEREALDASRCSVPVASFSVPSAQEMSGRQPDSPAFS
jgi:hypothetical protein